MERLKVWIDCPLSSMPILAELLLIAHRLDELIEQSRKTIDMDPAFRAAHSPLAQGYLAKHKYAEAIAELQKAVQLSGDSPGSTLTHSRDL
jgi:DNA-binding SARP family transcriptional activator